VDRLWGIADILKVLEDRWIGILHRARSGGIMVPVVTWIGFGELPWLFASRTIKLSVYSSIVQGDDQRRR
jgi:hypothetical protein